MNNHHRQLSGLRQKAILALMMLTAVAALWFDQETIDQTPSILAAIPSSMDLRVFPSFKRIDFSVKEEGVCVGASWALAISQTFSDMMTLKQNETLTFSAQDLLECTYQDQNNICHSTNITMIQQALDRLKNVGIAKSDCYPFNPLLTPNKCAKLCPSNNSTIGRYKAQQIKQVPKDITSVTNQIGNYGPILAIVEYHDTLNYYSSGVLNNTGELYGHLIMEVVGWKDQGRILIAKGNFGTSWGMNGIVHLNLNDSTLKKLYAISLEIPSINTEIIL